MPPRPLPLKRSGPLMACVLLLLPPAMLSTAADSASELPLLFQDDFESGDVSGWTATDPNAWKLDAQGEAGNHVFSQFQQSEISTPVRSPFNRALHLATPASSFQFDVDVQSTARDYPHRSLCLFFGYRDPTHFYYVHLGQRTDDHANQIFIVNEAPRTRVSTKTTDGTPWDNEWHHVRITRDARSGAIAVYFDDMDAPVMTARDKTFSTGAIGIGSFDDTGNFDNVQLRGVPPP